MNKSLKNEVQQKLAYTKSGIKRKAKGKLEYDYLVPAGPYEEQWDWDAFFMGVALSAQISSEAIYLRNWALNYILNANDEGKVAGCVTFKGADSRLNHMKPLLAQGTYIASKFLKDYSWIEPYWDNLIKIVTYRERNLWNKKYDLGVWYDSMESGADNNVSAYKTESLKGMEKDLGNNHDQIRRERGGYIREKIKDYDKGTIIATDVNAFLYREYIALSKLAEKLGKNSENRNYKEKAEEIKTNINKYLWNKEDGIYYNLNAKTDAHIKHISYSCFLPLWANIATKKRGELMIKEYLLDHQHLWSQYGVRSLSKKDDFYNNVNMLKPHSNWQGPIWPIANYIYMHSLLNYGFQQEAIEVAEKISKLVLRDINKTEGMHECYNAETGKPLSAPDFISWNILVMNMIEEAETKTNPFNIA